MTRRFKKGYAWCLTINNPRFVPDIKMIEDIIKDPDSHEVAFLYAGREHYSMIDIKYRKLTPHFQMIIVFGAKKTFKDVKKLFPRAHIEAAVGSFLQAYSYCCKEDKNGYKCGQQGWAEYLHDNYLRSGQYLIDNPIKPSMVGPMEGVGDGKYYQSPPLPSLKSSPGSVDIDGERYDAYDPFGDPAVLAEDWEFDRLNVHPKYFD